MYACANYTHDNLPEIVEILKDTMSVKNNDDNTTLMYACINYKHPNLPKIVEMLKDTMYI